ncbi:MAG TPA: hypothetical protein VFU46_00175 [Gemmatimonadales bacterium]|nr:hypothetical protein [Gemmatimonadales bacterium]
MMPRPSGRLAVWPSPAALVALFATVTPPVAAQTEAALKEYFEGRTVTVRLDLPATEDGVDVYPAAAQPIDYARYQSRVKRYGVALRQGESATVTKVKVKGKLIEFQLGGGGYGTAGDPTDPSVGFTPLPRSDREKALEEEIKAASDPVVKRRLQQELDYLRLEREREDRRNQAIAAEATERRRDHIQQRRLASGSRFNLRWRDAVPARALLVEGLQEALAPYVDFSAAVPEPALPSALRKGLSVEEVEALLGGPVRVTERMEGTLHVSTRTFDHERERIVADFVEGVLVRYEIRSN